MEMTEDQKRLTDWRRHVIQVGIKGGDGEGAIRLSRQDLRCLKQLLQPQYCNDSLGMQQLREVVFAMEEFLAARENKQ